MATGHPTHVHVKSPDEATAVGSDEDKAKAAATAAEQPKADPDEKFVLYTTPRNAAASVVSRPSGEQGDGSLASAVGVASAVARITPADWNQVGISATDTLQWDFTNNWRIPASKLSHAQLDYLLRNSSKRFELVDGNGNQVKR